MIQYQEIFVAPDGKFERTNLVKYNIDTHDSKPIKFQYVDYLILEEKLWKMKQWLKSRDFRKGFYLYMVSTCCRFKDLGWAWPHKVSKDHLSNAKIFQKPFKLLYVDYLKPYEGILRPRNVMPVGTHLDGSLETPPCMIPELPDTANTQYCSCYLLTLYQISRHTVYLIF